MSIITKRLVSIAASTVVLSLVSASANAQTDVLNLQFGNEAWNISTLVSTYTFNQPMILNSIGFASNGEGFSTISYTLNDTVVDLMQSPLNPVDSNRIQWYDLANGGLSVNASSVLKVTTRGTLRPPDSGSQQNYYKTYVVLVNSTNPNSNVTSNGLTGNFSGVNTAYTNSNLRVSPANPGSNVAPEPGSFALALTGGAALIGICVRRRRNAG